MKSVKTQSARKLKLAELRAIQSAVIECAEKRPKLLATRLAMMPRLANGLKDLDYIIGELLKAGFKFEVLCMLDSKALHFRERLIIQKGLLLSEMD